MLQAALICIVYVEKHNVINYMQLSNSGLIFWKLHNKTGIFCKIPCFSKLKNILLEEETFQI